MFVRQKGTAPWMKLDLSLDTLHTTIFAWAFSIWMTEQSFGEFKPISLPIPIVESYPARRKHSLETEDLTGSFSKYGFTPWQTAEDHEEDLSPLVLEVQGLPLDQLPQEWSRRRRWSPHSLQQPLPGRPAKQLVAVAGQTLVSLVTLQYQGGVYPPWVISIVRHVPFSCLPLWSDQHSPNQKAFL